MCAAIEGLREACLKLLLGRRGRHDDVGTRAYVNIASGWDSPLKCTFDLGRPQAPRIERFSLDQGADTTTKVQFELEDLGVLSDEPLVAANVALHQAEIIFEHMDDGVKGIIRVLQQEEAVHAVSWSWPDTSSVVRKRTAGRPKMLAATMARCVALAKV